MPQGLAARAAFFDFCHVFHTSSMSERYDISDLCSICNHAKRTPTACQFGAALRVQPA
ncbi:hypothetical protein Rmet_6431 [Cupriavidus metallidurans CH34]|uniref:Uncharacterized protein n=1 Tax=Cupriavidus metallidurans (strain ATCC 43123 / DSM 2839 / NBRC 102507 / CH34) TaxID=266264 RepID=D3DXM8_CUPMC|nr:hypothetical protein Rmet_6431 [Cupriavidus metallidurans CH34]